MIETEFVLRRFETVFDRPAMSFDFRQPFDGRPVWSPCREEGEVAVDDFAPDQKAARPFLTGERRVVFAGVEIGELEIGTVVQPLALGSRARRETPPRGGGQSVGSVFSARRAIRLNSLSLPKKFSMRSAGFVKLDVNGERRAPSRMLRDDDLRAALVQFSDDPVAVEGLVGEQRIR